MAVLVQGLQGALHGRTSTFLVRVRDQSQFRLEVQGTRKVPVRFVGGRLLLPVGVAYGSDVPLAMKLMQEAARENEKIIDEPAPLITFDSFGDNALTLTARVYIDNLDHRMSAISELHSAINEKFNKAGIVIAFPQRDVHLDTSQPLEIRINKDEISDA